MEEDKNNFNKDNEQTPAWLQTIQLNSWEAELLISALVLYALFQIPDYLDSYSHQNFERGSHLIMVFRILKSSIQLLQLGYILHIMVRGIWVASVGFSYVFPAGINHKNLKFKGKFKKELEKNPSLIRNVLWLEELSSMIYGLSFTIFGIFIGLSSLLFFFLFVMNYTSAVSQDSILEQQAFFGFFSLIYGLCSILLFIDFITSGLFRRKEWAIDWFYPLAWFFRLITLSFLYRRSMLVLVSNLNGWRARLVPPIIAVILGGFYYFNDKSGNDQIESYFADTKQGEFIPGNYENLRKKEDYLLCSIQSDITSESYIKLFLRDISLFRNLQDSPFDNEEIKWSDQSSDSSSYYLSKWLTVSVDSYPLSKIHWVNTKHPVNQLFGFYGYLDIYSLERGAHSLKITVDTVKMSKVEKQRFESSIYNNTVLADIIFQYDKP